MKTTVGLWIDHRKAILMTILDKGESVREIVSNVEKQQSRSEGKRSGSSHESRNIEPDDLQENSFTGHLNVFYDEVIGAIRGADSMLLLGPGEAKKEFRKRLLKSGLGDRIAGVEAADKMTVPQLKARIQGSFSRIKAQAGRPVARSRLAIV